MNNIIRIPNINNYHQAIINNELVLTPIYNYITLDELFDKNLTNSKSNYCIITDTDVDNTVISNSNKNYKSILIDIYKYLPASFILQNTTFNIKLTNEKGNKGYTWYPEINMSVQNKESNLTIKEIIKMINLNNFKIDIRIELSNKEIINYKNN
jgi:hypothetical protein